MTLSNVSQIILICEIPPVFPEKPDYERILKKSFYAEIYHDILWYEL